MEFYETVRRRKMVRAFRPDPVPPEVLERVLSTMLKAPSAGFTQGNEHLVITDAAEVSTYFELTENPDDPSTDEERATRPPVVIIPMANASAYVARYSAPDKIRFGLDRADAWPVPFWTVDASMAAMLVLLAAVDEGLGALYAGIATGQDRVLHHFGVPAEFSPVGVIHLGYPADHDPISAGSSATTRARRPLADIVHHDRW